MLLKRRWMLLRRGGDVAEEEKTLLSRGRVAKGNKECC